MPSVDRATLTERVYLGLRQQLFQGRHQPGARLNEKELAVHFGVSPTPIREALNKLRSEGLVDYKPWLGTVVTAFGRDDLVHLSNIRLYLECLAVREAAACLTPLDHKELARRHMAYVRATEQATPGAAAVSVANAAFHGFFAEKSGNRWLQHMLSGLDGLLELARRPLTEHRTGADSVPEHAAIVSALERGDIDAAEQAMRGHLERVADALVTLAGSLP